VKKDINVSSKSNMQKKLSKKIFLSCNLEGRENSRLKRYGSESVPKCHGSATLLFSF